MVPRMSVLALASLLCRHGSAAQDCLGEACQAAEADAMGLLQHHAEKNIQAEGAGEAWAWGPVGADLEMCDSKQICKKRHYDLPADRLASTCDTLGDLGGVAEVSKFQWTAARTQQIVQLTFYKGVYCTGDAVEHSKTWQGKFHATNAHGGWFKLEVPAWVKSIRPTVVVGAADQGAHLLGVKMVMWPMYNQDRAVGTADEFDCMKAHPNVNVGKHWPNKGCASPVDRVWCVHASGNNLDWGILDHLNNLDFADNHDQARLFDGDTGSGFPMGSVLMDKYTSSWTRPACSANPFAGPPLGKCVVTKLYSIRCNEVTRSSGLNSWHSVKAAYTLKEGQSLNSGGASGPWPVPIKCAWTRVVDC